MVKLMKGIAKAPFIVLFAAVGAYQLYREFKNFSKLEEDYSL